MTHKWLCTHTHIHTLGEAYTRPQALITKSLTISLWESKLDVNILHVFFPRSMFHSDCDGLCVTGTQRGEKSQIQQGKTSLKIQIQRLLLSMFMESSLLPPFFSEFGCGQRVVFDFTAQARDVILN